MLSDQAFWNRTADKYYRSGISDEDAYAHKLKRTEEHYTAQSDLLEVGCGTGMTAAHHARKVRSYLATDVSGKMLDYGRQRASEAGLDNLRFERRGLHEVADLDETFDMVLALSILHLVPDLDRSVMTLKDRLRPGGTLVTSTPCLGDFPFYIHLMIPAMRLFGNAPEVRFFSRDDLRDSLRKAGLTIVEDWQPKGRMTALFLIAKRDA